MFGYVRSLPASATQPADVTLAVSGHLPELAKSLEADGHKPRVVADFLTRCRVGREFFACYGRVTFLLPQKRPESLGSTEFVTLLPLLARGWGRLVF